LELSKEAAKNAVQYLFGVRGVSNLIEIKTPIQSDLVKESIKKTFERNAIIDAEKINVRVEGHKVFLTGTVHHGMNKNKRTRQHGLHLEYGR